jgi:acetylornithine/succinyldiaminopimelate/putrescine aminotransferase
VGRQPHHDIQNVSRSLADLTGEEYAKALCVSKAFMDGGDEDRFLAIAHEKVDFYPDALARRLDELVQHTGTKVSPGLEHSARGATSERFREASKTAPAPLTGLGPLRVGEDGRLYFAAKAEHYHLSVGHGFPGYRIVENARRLGVPNATHNNTRGHITRLLEEELVAAANGTTRSERSKMEALLAAKDARTLNRVINLETGSLVAEAAVKMALARFYRFEPENPRDTAAHKPSPKYAGKIPVILVMADFEGGTGANYHGTTMVTQAMRGLWPEIQEKLESSDAVLVRPVRINDIADFEAVLEKWDRGRCKVAAFFHEIVLMNYGAVRLEEEYLRRAYALCNARDVLTVADEIQSCVWSPEVFMFREYGLSPDVVAAGKGFPGGEYAAARVLCNATSDTLAQFGALVTNGQQEIASLAYLVTMEFTRANSAAIRDIGDHYEAELKALAARHSRLVEKMEGRRHLASLFFHKMDTVAKFVALLNERGIDISVQSYKPSFPPSCLTKLPLITSWDAVDFLVGRMDEALKSL